MNLNLSGITSKASLSYFKTNNLVTPNTNLETHKSLFSESGMNNSRSKIPSNKVLVSRGILNRSNNCVYQNQATTINTNRPLSARSGYTSSRYSHNLSQSTKFNKQEENKDVKHITPRLNNHSILNESNEKKNFITEKKNKKELRKNILKLLQVVRPISSKLSK